MLPHHTHTHTDIGRVCHFNMTSRAGYALAGLLYVETGGGKQEQLKLQAAMEGTSHPAPPTGGFRKIGNGKQCAFKKVNIEERVIVIYICQTCCQLVALCP